MPATVEAALLAFAQRRRSVPPALETFELPAWPSGALEATLFVWKRRVVNESSSVDLAINLGACLDRTALKSRTLGLAIDRLIEDERAHVALAAAFVVRLGGEPPIAEPSIPPPESDDPLRMLVRYVLTGLCICETVSAARFAVVRGHTDLPIPLACIELFLRDEVAHSDLGFTLLPLVLTHCSLVHGEGATTALVKEELASTFRHLDLVVGLDADRRGLELAARPQLPDNAAVVEPVLDAIAFRESIEHQVIPRLSKLGVGAAEVWAARWVTGR